MAEKTRTYLLTHKTTGKQHLVEATQLGTAFRFIAEREYEGHMPTQRELIAAMSNGVKPVTANADPDSGELFQDGQAQQAAA